MTGQIATASMTTPRTPASTRPDSIHGPEREQHGPASRADQEQQHAHAEAHGEECSAALDGFTRLRDVEQRAGEQ
ncbi:MAG: hypothetical protein U1E63_01915 [Burkholderiales bacterium]